MDRSVTAKTSRTNRNSLSSNYFYERADSRVGLNLFSRRELLTTETELNDMAAAANRGFKRIPYVG